VSKNKDGDELLRAQIDALIRDEIQEGINDYIDETEKETEGGFGFVKKDEKDKLKVKISNDGVDKLIKEYKKIKRQQKSNLGQVKLLDQHGRHLEN
tara:strand:+ start:1710 stop:1997 length:288 start_codon:yes stop_codon:yes gene_type:complete